MRTLLLADDSVTTQRVIALTFAEESFRVITVADGQQAIDSMAVMRPDIVLASTSLPRTDGYELAAYMRGVETLRDVPVLLLSGAFESMDAVRLKASGARGVIEKPLEPIAVISRVRELLGLKETRPATPTGRLVTSGDTPADRKPAPRPPAAPSPAHPAAVSSWNELRQESGLEPNAESVEGGPPGSGREDYLDTLDAAFDSLDQHLAGGHQEAHPQHRNPSPPLGQSSGAPDPRSPGRRPSPTSGGVPANAVFEVDSDWFSDEHTAGDTESRNDIIADARAAMPPRPDVPGNPIFEVDDEWFAEDEKAREARRAQQRDLAAEMGIHDVELPEAEPVPNAPAPPEGLDFDFGLDDLMPVGHPKQELAATSPLVPAAIGPPPFDAATTGVVQRKPFDSGTAGVAQDRPTPWASSDAPIAPMPPAPLPAPPVPHPVTAAPSAPAPIPFASLALPPLAASVLVPTSVADDFAALLAFETGDAVLDPEPAPEVPPVALVAGQVPAPEITDAMLDQIAEQVADRLESGAFGARLRDALTSTVRDTVRSVVADTSERLVRDEIERIKSKTQS